MADLSTGHTETRLKGEVTIIEERCKGCGYCVSFCPTHVLVFSEQTNRSGYLFPIVALPQQCTGCDLCGMYCPDFAIRGRRISVGGSR
jgi:2-oxoglutarate ferredoxin oxidoreductase subunit delta